MVLPNFVLTNLSQKSLYACELFLVEDLLQLLLLLPKLIKGNFHGIP